MGAKQKGIYLNNPIARRSRRRRFFLMSETPKKTPQSRVKLPVYPSMASCSGATGIPLAVLKQSKRDGCDAFDRKNRVHLTKLLPWIFRETDDGGNSNWPERLKRAQALLAEMEVEAERNRLVDFDAVIERVAACVSRARSVLDSKLRIDLPARLAGRPAEEIQSAIEAALDQAYSDIQGAAHK
jgi:hypothetical protein